MTNDPKKSSKAPDWQRKLGITAITLKLYPEAKRALLADGWKPETVAALPVLKVVFLHILHQFQGFYDDMAKWMSVPYWQAQGGLTQADADRQRARQSLHGFLLLADMVPNVEKVYLAQVRLDRRIAALRCVEAIRLYAADHDGELPARIRDIKEVPIPVDPVTGKEFEYKVDGNKATLFGPPPRGQAPDIGNALQYDLTLKK